MEIKILISDSSAGVVVQNGAGAPPGSPGATGSGAQPGAGAQPGQATPTSADPWSGIATDAGRTGVGSSVQAGMPTGSAVQPPAYLLRAAAALGARNGGPAPMLSGWAGGISGEPLQFTNATIAAPVMAALGAPDQSAGAAPGAESSTPTQVIEDQDSSDDGE
jgi:hypothetical protein